MGSPPREKVVLVMDTPAYLLRSITALYPNGKRVVEQIRALTNPPNIATARPIC